MFSALGRFEIRAETVIKGKNAFGSTANPVRSAWNFYKCPGACLRSINSAMAAAYSNNPTPECSKAATRVADEGVALAKSGYRPTLAEVPILGFLKHEPIQPYHPREKAHCIRGSLVYPSIKCFGIVSRPKTRFLLPVQLFLPARKRCEIRNKIYCSTRQVPIWT